jgi:hypothetical protein
LGEQGCGVDDAAVDTAISAVSRLLMNRECEMNHGPIGAGMEITTGRRRFSRR